jgi:hypothetical protein
VSAAGHTTPETPGFFRSIFKDLATFRFALSGETNAAAAGGRILDPPCPAAGNFVRLQFPAEPLPARVLPYSLQIFGLKSASLMAVFLG